MTSRISTDDAASDDDDTWCELVRRCRPVWRPSPQSRTARAIRARQRAAMASARTPIYLVIDGHSGAVVGVARSAERAVLMSSALTDAPRIRRMRR